MPAKSQKPKKWRMGDRILKDEKFFTGLASFSSNPKQGIHANRNAFPTTPSF
jgi:hypothetical protein